MNSNQFAKELEKQLSEQRFDVQFFIDWHARTLEQLVVLSKQRRGVAHPRDRGDARETDLTSILRRLFPSSFRLERGYAINRLTSKSREQDILIYDGLSGTGLAGTETISYIPIEAVLGSIEVKSNLTLPELRRSAINAVSLKKLRFDKGFDDFREPRDVGVCYSIFAYDSPRSIRHVADQLSDVMSAVPHHLQVNMVYILGKGIIVPSYGGGAVLTAAHVMRTSGEFLGLKSMGTKSIPESDAIPFLCFLSNLLDHCLQERSRREPVDYASYSLGGFLFQMEMEKIIEKQTGKGESAKR